MKKLIQLSATPALIAGMAVLSPAIAADMEAPPSDTNIDVYVGVAGGYMWGEAGFKPKPPSNTWNEDSKADLGILSAIAGIDMRSEGWLYGLEADIGVPLGSFPDDDDLPDTMQWSDMKYNAHLRARIGRSIDNVDIFVAGGLAIAQMEAEEGGNNENVTLTGFTVGGGVDWGFNDLFKARLEVLYDDYGDEDTFSPGSIQYSGDWSSVTVRGGLLFSF